MIRFPRRNPSAHFHYHFRTIFIVRTNSDEGRATTDDTYPLLSPPILLVSSLPPTLCCKPPPHPRESKLKSSGFTKRLSVLLPAGSDEEEETPLQWAKSGTAPALPLLCARLRAPTLEEMRKKRCGAWKNGAHAGLDRFHLQNSKD